MPEAFDQITDELGREDDRADRARDKAIDRLEYVQALRAILRAGMSLSKREQFTLCELAEELLEPLIAE